MKEDGALAQRLQSEEIVQHYARNRYLNGVLRHDVPHVRQEQQLEDMLSAGDYLQQQERLFQQSAADAATARRLAAEQEDAPQLHHNLRERQEQKQRQEEEDARLARQLADKDKQLRRQHRERRQVDEEVRMLGLESGIGSLSVNGSTCLGATAASCAGGNGHHPDSDLSDLMAPPPDGELLSEEDYRSWQEQQDEEVAILLQEQDVKRRGDLIPREKQVAIEAQDRELAKVLQEQERARIRRAKQRAREKRRQRREQQELQIHEYENQCGAANFEHRSGSPLSDSPVSCRREDTTSYPISSFSERQEDSVGGRISPLTERQECNNGYLAPASTNHADLCCHLPLPETVPPGVDNIATVIDPTYRRQMANESPSSSCRSQPLSQSHLRAVSGRSRDNSSGSCKDRVADMTSSGHLPRHGNAYGDEFVPPYMPLQGQRRSPISSIAEQRIRQHRRGKDQGCKQQ